MLCKQLVKTAEVAILLSDRIVSFLIWFYFETYSIYSVVVASGVQQSGSVINNHISILFEIPFQYRPL